MEDVSEAGWNYRLFEGRLKVGIVLVHEWMGQDDYARQVGTDLSEEGFSVALVDLFRGKLAKDREEAVFLSQHVQREEVLDCMAGGLRILRERLGPGAPIGSMGFCMGGGFALLAACNIDLYFCVDYYGMIKDAEEAKSLRGSIILFLGSEDPRVTPWAIKDLLPALVEHKKRADVHLYPNAGHAFHRPDWGGHSPLAASDAWKKTLTFLHRFHEESA